MDAPQPQPTPEGKPSVETNPLKQIRTFQGDVASALSDQKESLFSIQQTEQLKRSSGGTIAEDSGDNDKKRQEFLFLVFGSLFLIFLGGVGAWFGYKEFTKRSAPPTIIAPESRFIAVQEEIDINFASTTRETFFSVIIEQSASLPTNTLKHFTLRSGVGNLAPLTTTSEFFQKLDTGAPGSLVRAFDPLFMLGSLGQSRFILVKLVSFENAFPGMLSWEKTMARDIGPLFATLPILKTIGSESVFKDVISRNKDVRVLSIEATTTQPVLLYSFFDNRVLIITDSLETLRVLMERLTQELLSR